MLSILSESLRHIGAVDCGASDRKWLLIMQDYQRLGLRRRVFALRNTLHLLGRFERAAIGDNQANQRSRNFHVKTELPVLLCFKTRSCRQKKARQWDA